MAHFVREPRKLGFYLGKAFLCMVPPIVFQLALVMSPPSLLERSPSSWFWPAFFLVPLGYVALAVKLTRRGDARSRPPLTVFTEAVRWLLAVFFLTAILWQTLSPSWKT